MKYCSVDKKEWQVNDSDDEILTFKDEKVTSAPLLCDFPRATRS